MVSFFSSYTWFVIVLFSLDTQAGPTIELNCGQSTVTQETVSAYCLGRAEGNSESQSCTNVQAAARGSANCYVSNGNPTQYFCTGQGCPAEKECTIYGHPTITPTQPYEPDDDGSNPFICNATPDPNGSGYWCSCQYWEYVLSHESTRISCGKCVGDCLEADGGESAPGGGGPGAHP